MAEANQIEHATELIVADSEDMTLETVLSLVTAQVDENASLVFDLATKKGEGEARSHVAKLRRIKAPVAEIHKRLKASYKAITDQMDADKRKIIAVVDEMIELHDAPLRVLKEARDREAERKRIDAEIESVWDLAHRENELWDNEVEFRAEMARLAAQKEEQDRISRERQIAAAAEQRAREQAEAKMLDDQERKRAQEEQARQDGENRKRVHNAILSCIVDRCADIEAAKSIILDARDGKIPHLRIDYTR